MSARGKLKITVYLLGFGGAALFTVLLIHQGIAPIAVALATARWAILAVAAFHLLPIFLDALAWWVLFPRPERPAWRSLFWMRWIGESISNLVPSAQVGGDIIRARLATISGAKTLTAVATVIVDVVLGLLPQVGFTLVGLALLVQVTQRTDLVKPTLIGSVVGIAAIIGVYVAQRLGMFRFVGLLIIRLVKSPEWSTLVGGGEQLDHTVLAVYHRPRGVIWCVALTIVSLIASSGEIWIALWALGWPASFTKAFILQSMAMTVRSAAFAVPGQLGVQESGYLLVGTLLGIPGDTAFAVSLITRCRDLVIGIPGLVTWQLIEGRRLWRTRRIASER